MMSSIGSVFECSRSRVSSATSGPRVASWGIHPSTYYRWAKNIETWGLEALRPRERRRPRMPNQLPEWVEHRILAFSLAHPGLGPRRISAELARERWGGLRVSPNGVWRCLSRHGLGHRRARLSLVAGYAAPPEPERTPEPERHLDAPHPGAFVGMDCFYVGRLQGTKGVCWQHTAIDAHSGLAWAELHTTDKNPAARFCSALSGRVASDRAAAGWRLEAITTDNGSEFRNEGFTAQVMPLAPGIARSGGTPYLQRSGGAGAARSWRSAGGLRSLAPSSRATRRSAVTSSPTSITTSTIAPTLDDT